MNDVKDFCTVRVTFSKTGAARYISHLDLNRTMIRALRRAQLPIWYTEGFNKHPYVTFAAPLSLGYEGERETMDIRLNEEMSMDELANRLDEVMPIGLRVLGAAPAVKKAGDVDRAVYELRVSGDADTIREWMALPQILTQKRTKKKAMKEIDLRPVLDASSSELQETENGTLWRLTLPCNSTESVNPTLVVEALRTHLGQEELAVCVRRLQVLDKDGEVFA